MMNFFRRLWQKWTEPVDFLAAPYPACDWGEFADEDLPDGYERIKGEPGYLRRID